MKLQESDSGDGPTFGMVLRGARLGWRWSPRHGGFVRIRMMTDRASVELYPPKLMPSPHRLSDTPSVCWWEDEGFLDLITELRTIRRVKRPIYFEVPFNREVVRGCDEMEQGSR